LWITFGLGLFVVSAALSGTVLVFKDEIDAALFPNLREVTPGFTTAPLQTVLHQAEAAVPGGQVQLLMTARYPGDTHEAWIQPAGTSALTDLRLVYVHPATAEVLGQRPVTKAPMLVLHYWHSQLLFGGPIGTGIVTLGGLALLALCLTGIVLWWPKKGKLRRALTIKRRQPWHRLLYDLHRAAGFYLLPLLVLITITGLALVYHDATETAINQLTGSPPEPEVPALEAPAATATPLPADSLQAVAMQLFPEALVTRLMFPREATAPFTVRLKAPSEVHPNGKTYVVMNPYTAEVLAVRDAANGPVGWRLIDLLYPLHKGGVGGIWTKVLHALCGLMVVVFAITGLIMWWKRTRTRPRRRAAAPPTPTRHARDRTPVLPPA
jgi:uncharacterized iron-regulated membrane protein